MVPVGFMSGFLTGTDYNTKTAWERARTQRDLSKKAGDQNGVQFWDEVIEYLNMLDTHAVRAAQTGRVD